MNIASAFLMGTKIKEVDVPANPWSKMTAIPNTSGDYVEKSGISYNGKIYASWGSESVAQYATSTVTIHCFNGTSWTDAVTLTTPASEWSNWIFNRGQILYFIHNNKMYVVYAQYGDYGSGGPVFGWTFDGTTWQSWSVPTYTLSQAIEKNGTLYLFQTVYEGSWNRTYGWDVYEYNDTTGEATRVAQRLCWSIWNSDQSGMPRIRLYNNKIYAIVNHEFYAINDDWTYTQLNSFSSARTSLIVYKNKLHAFGGADNLTTTGSHKVYDVVNDSWEDSDDIPYWLDNNYSSTFPIIHKSKLWLLGGNQQLVYDSSLDDVYRYNR